MTGIQLDHTTLGLPLHLLESSEVLEQMELLYWNGPSALPASNMTLQPGQTPVPELDAGKHMKKTGKKLTYNRDMNATKRPETAFFRYLNEQRKHITTELRQSGLARSRGNIATVARERWNAMRQEAQMRYKAAYAPFID